MIFSVNKYVPVYDDMHSPLRARLDFVFQNFCLFFFLQFNFLFGFRLPGIM